MNTRYYVDLQVIQEKGVLGDKVDGVVREVGIRGDLERVAPVEDHHARLRSVLTRERGKPMGLNMLYLIKRVNLRRKTKKIN